MKVHTIQKIYHIIFARTYKTLQNVIIPGTRFNSSGTTLFHDPMGRGSCIRKWLYKSYSENAFFLFKNVILLLGIDQTK